MAVRIQGWLAAQGFQSNPFEYWEADRETTLSGYFVQAEWFDALRGDVRQPQSAVLFAPRGYGKSSHRVQIARLCGAASEPALVVQVTQYDWLPTTEPVNERHYLRYIADQAANTLWEHHDRLLATRGSSPLTPVHQLQLHGLMRWAAMRSLMLLPRLGLDDAQRAELARRLRLAPGTEQSEDLLIDAIVEYYERAQQSVLLADLVALARLAGFAALYVLIDRVDEDRVTEHDAAAALARVHPLISNLHILEFPGVACKFFLPDHLRDMMLSRRVSRIGERLPTYTLSWQADDLCDLLSRRLAFYSRPAGSVSGVSAVQSFQDLCEPGCDADRRLVAAARGSPRRLIMSAGNVVAFHCGSAASVEQLISDDTLAMVLDRALPLLCLDAQGRIWIGGVRRDDIRMPKLLRKVLEFLWQHRHRPYVTRDELVDAFYTSGQQPESIARVITRLRETLEPNRKNSKNYIDVVEGVGYQLINFEDTPL